MKIGSICSGECCICACGSFCIAGHGDDNFCTASNEEIIKRLDNNQYPSYRDYMINYLKVHGCEYHPKANMQQETKKDTYISNDYILIVNCDTNTMELKVAEKQ